jgi:hypothetical protein
LEHKEIKNTPPWGVFCHQFPLLNIMYQAQEKRRVVISEGEKITEADFL